MSSVGKSGDSAASKSTASTSRSQKSETTSKTKSTSKTADQPTSSKPDRSTLSGERGKVGSVPDLAQSFGNPAASKPATTLRQGSKGDEVKQLQEMLKSRGAQLDADGNYGPKTAAAVRAFQEEQKISTDGIAGPETWGKLQPQGGGPGEQPKAETPKAETPGEQPKAETPGVKPEEKPAQTPAASGPLDLPAGYESLERLGSTLGEKDPRFSQDTPEGRSATALALAIGGTEVYGKGTKGSDFFTRKGGTGNNMLGFAQFNQKYHAGKTNTPEKYTKFLGDILHGQARMPDSKSKANHVQALTNAVSSGKIKTGQDLRNFMAQQRFGGSNWQGIDDGWGRNPGLADSLVNFLRQGAS